MRKPQKKFKARKGARISHKQAEKYGKELDKIAKRHGGHFTPDIVIEEAKKADNPLHEYFDWNNTVAAKNWRLHQARMLTAFIVLELEDGTEVRSTYRVDDEDAGNIYVTLKTMVEDEKYHRQTVEKAFGELNAWRERYRIYKELKPVIHAIDKARKELVKV